MKMSIISSLILKKRVMGEENNIFLDATPIEVTISSGSTEFTIDIKSNIDWVAKIEYIKKTINH